MEKPLRYYEIRTQFPFNGNYFFRSWASDIGEILRRLGICWGALASWAVKPLPGESSDTKHYLMRTMDGEIFEISGTAVLVNQLATNTESVLVAGKTTHSSYARFKLYYKNGHTENLSTPDPNLIPDVESADFQWFASQGTVNPQNIQTEVSISDPKTETRKLFRVVAGVEGDDTGYQMIYIVSARDRAGVKALIPKCIEIQEIGSALPEYGDTIILGMRLRWSEPFKNFTWA